MAECITTIGRGHGAPVQPATREMWEAEREKPELAEMCRRIEAGEEQLKSKLPVWTPRCAEFRDGHRSEADALKPLGRLMFDIDEKGHTDDILALMKDGWIGNFEVLLVEESVRRGTHILVTLPTGLTPDEAQTQFAETIGLTVDPAVKNVAGCIYQVPSSHTRFISEKFGDPLDEQTPLRDSSAALPSQNDIKGTEGLSIKGEQGGGLPGVYASTYDGIPYEEIVGALTSQLGGVPTHGSRNNFIFAMACHLRYVCDDDPEWIASVLPTYGEDESRWRRTIESACKRAQRREMPTLMQRALYQARTQLTCEQESAGTMAQMPEMPRRLPKVLQVLTSRLPEHYKPAVAQSVFAPLGAHLYDVRFRYIDNTEHEATVMNVLMAPQSSGKGCVNKPIEYIMEDIKQRDDMNRDREQNWKDTCNKKSANKEGPERPDGLCIQYILSDMTNAALVQRLADANGRFLYCKMNEIELLNQLKANGKGDTVSEIIRLAWDADDYGQERVGTQSVTARTQVRWNWNASTTIERGKYFFRNGLQDGTVSRICFSTIIVPEDYDELIPTYGVYDARYARQLAPYIERLNEAQGLIRCKKAEQLAVELLKENRVFADLSDDENFRTLSYRANVQAYIKAMILYICNGMKWSEDIAEFVRWSERYDLWCKMRFFHDQMESTSVAKKATKPGPRNMLDMLPDEFTLAEFEELRAALGKDRKGASTLRSWVFRGYVEFDEQKGVYRKTGLGNVR